MLKVWADSLEAGFLDRNGAGRGATFAYLPYAQDNLAISLGMPKRLASYEQDYGLHPIFEMNLPEGVLRERLRLAFAKTVGTFDDLDVLSITGRSQMGRIRYTAPDGMLDDVVPFQSVDEILERRREGAFLDHLLDKFARFSGVCGVQPKVLIRDEEASNVRGSVSFRGATHIVKFWDPAEYPQLAANEFFCLMAAQKAGLDVPRNRLSEDAAALVIDRFDLRNDGTYRGMEDFCVLNGKQASEKYAGGYERGVFRRLKDNVNDPQAWLVDAERLYTLFALNCGLRNGDAHLKNFALVYDGVDQVPRLAPVYDLVTTAAYIPADRMALTLNGRSTWPEARHLDELATTRCHLSPSAAAAIRERVADALSATARTMRDYAAEHPDFAEIYVRMAAIWSESTRTSLVRF